MPTLDWIGKAAVVNHHREVPTRLLHCDSELSFGDPEAGNLLVQGDNLEALKALLPYYAGKVKCIYIDPPYNTGNIGWTYNDRVDSIQIREWLSRQVGKEGEDLSRHDKWLCMMYPRLRLLFDILSDGGLIFISIDDNEVSSLRIVMDEIWGRNNFVAQFVWNTDGHTDNQFSIKINHEYIVCYAKKSKMAEFGYVIDPNIREESNLWAGFAENSITKNGPANPPSEIILPVGFPISVDAINLSPTTIPEGIIEALKEGNLGSNSLKKKFPGIEFPLRFDAMIGSNGKLTQECRVYSGWANRRKLQKFIDTGCEPIHEDDGILQFYLSKNGVIYYRKDRGDKARNILSVLRDFGTTERMKSELESMGIVFSYPKPKSLISYLLQIGASEGDIVLDSFAGSGTTAQAVLELNQNKKMGLKFISIEMDPSTAENIHGPRMVKTINGYVKDGKSLERVNGTGGGFRFCTLGKPLFDEWGGVNDGVTFGDLAAFVFFSDTGSPIPAKATGATSLLGEFQGRAIHLLFAPGSIGVADAAAGNVLTLDVLETLPAHDGPRVVYAEGCTVPPERLAADGVVFKQVPYQLQAT